MKKPLPFTTIQMAKVLDPEEFGKRIVQRWSNDIPTPEMQTEQSRMDCTIMFFDRCYPMFVSMWMASGNQGFLPEHVAGTAKGVLHPHSKHFSDARAEMLEAQQIKGRITDKSVWTRVEQHFILAAALEMKLMGPGRTTAFVREVMEKTLLQTTLPVSWVGVNGKIESKGASSTTNTLPMVEALMRRWRNRIRPVVRNTAVAVQQEFQRIFCNPRGPIQPDRFDFEPAFEPGETLWTNHASFMRTGTKRSGQFAADINEAQASFVAGTIWDDESFYDPEAPPGEAVLKDGVRHPGWLHACITVEADVRQLKGMSESTDLGFDFTQQAPYSDSYCELAMKYHESIHPVMLDRMWGQIDDGVQSVSQQEIDARKMRKDEFDKKLQDIADDVVRSMLEAQVRGAVGASKDTKEDRMAEGILKTEWNPERYGKQYEKLVKKPHGQQRLKQWSAFYWWQPGGLALLDAIVATIINTNAHAQPHIRQLFPVDSFKLARFVEVRTRFHKENWNLLAPALNKYVRKVLETRMDDLKQPSLTGKTAKGRAPVVKEETVAGGSKTADKTKVAAMSQEELEEVSSSLKNFQFIQANKWPSRIKLPDREDAVCECTEECGPDCNNRKSQTECSIGSCPLRQSCTNLGGFMSPRSLPTTIVARSEMHAEGKHVGLGLFLSEGVKKRQEIDSYTGEVKTKEKLESDLLSRGNEAMRYDIELKPLPDGFKGGPMFIDAYAHGNKSRYINHACDPNCALEKWQREGLPIIKVMALQDMCAGTELTVSYNWGPEFQCHCGSKKCRYKREEPEHDEGSASGKERKKRNGENASGAGSKRPKTSTHQGEGSSRRHGGGKGGRLGNLQWSQDV